MSEQAVTRKDALIPRRPRGSALNELQAAMAGATPRPISSPPSSIDELKEERMDSFTFASFCAEDALELGYFLHARLAPYAAQGKPTLINITLASGQTVFQVATGSGITPDNETWVARKRATVMRFGVSTWLMHCKFNADEGAFAAKYCLGPESVGKYAIHGGGVPIRALNVEGIVAVVVVSGLKQEEDHGVIVNTINENYETA